MTGPLGPPDEDFPDVSVGSRTALSVTLGLLAIFVLAFWVTGIGRATHGPALLASAGLAASLILLSYMDLRTGLLLDAVTLPLIAAGLAWAALFTGAWVQALAGAALGYGLIAGLAAYWRKTRGYEGIGLGDAKLLAGGGAWVGVLGLPVILLIASILGLLAGVIVSSAPQSRQARLALPFGPCLGIGIWIVWCLTNVGLFNQSVPGT